MYNISWLYENVCVKSSISSPLETQQEAQPSTPAQSANIPTEAQSKNTQGQPTLPYSAFINVVKGNWNTTTTATTTTTTTTNQ
jgi:hypothetical protein